MIMIIKETTTPIAVAAPITGYRQLTAEEVDVINAIKDTEIMVGRLWRRVTGEEIGHDSRFASIAKTHFQEGFSALVRSVARPVDVFAVPDEER